MTGALLGRYRPTEAPEGAFTYKQNFPVNDDGLMCRLAGFERLFSALRVEQGPYATTTEAQAACAAVNAQYGGSIVFHNSQYWCSNYINWDFHHRPTPRKPLSKTWEITKSDGSRQFFASDESAIYYLNETSGQWVTIASGYGAEGTKWQAAVLQDVVIFTNNYDDILSYDLGAGAVATISDLKDVLHVSKARVVLQFAGLMFLMNTVEDGDNFPSRIRWSADNKPKIWQNGDGIVDENDPAFGSIAGFQDLDYGEEILAAAELKGSIIVLTNKALWRVYVSPDVSSAVVQAQKIYSEPKNNTGCIVYPDSLVSTGESLFYGSRESFYTYSPYLAAPESPEWLRQATGFIYVNPATKVNPNQCLGLCAEFRPLAKEIWISWATTEEGLNDYTLVLSSKYETGYIFNEGFTSFCTFKPVSTSGVGGCNTQQIFVGASSRDLSLKQIGEVLFREFVTGDTEEVTDDIESPTWTKEGYVSILRGVIPLGIPDREKILNNITTGRRVVAEANPPVARLRIGTSVHLVNPNDESCDIVWHDCGDLALKCMETQTPAQLKADGLIPSRIPDWTIYERGMYLYFEISIVKADGTAPTGGDIYLHKLDFNVLVLP